MGYREKLLQAADFYCERTGKSRATLATLVTNHGKFFDRIEGGGGCTVDTYEKVMSWIKENTPKN